MASSSSFFASPSRVFTAAIILRVALLFYGLYQDAHSAMKYTDIDYYVFTDAARFVLRGKSPYDRATYRYTPLLAWLLMPTAWAGSGPLGSLWFSFGKALFAFADIVAGWLIVQVLIMKNQQAMDVTRALKYASIWLLNPMVATISTRGSSEGLLGVMVIALLWAVLQRRIILAGCLLGLGVHFKIYPFIYGPAIIWYLDNPEQSERVNKDSSKNPNLIAWDLRFATVERITLTLVALGVFTALNVAMYMIYGFPFLQHTFLHHLTRVDHRHNFSPYNMLLYLSSSNTAKGIPGNNFESLAFIPQLSLSAILIPLVLAKKDLAGSMLAQTFAFVAFNKVCTSQYFLWYIIFLPLYLPYSSLIAHPILGATSAALWTAAQALWLQQGFRLEFLGISTFMPGLFVSCLVFFTINVWILGIIVSDVGMYRPYINHETKASTKITKEGLMETTVIE
ncbi:Mannosyltransferase family protein [Coccidioides posadasii C735 delta SOWgp]|uniref:GPI mannosyltransferase 1 n=1 Tax=Coccidioides posadasii (strain C735) TaxID=222929 RepID=C5PJE8_COCP7|nr:Mannosyltransferase family protein [Coccidioides posadasii C735 delta SOWgp]EER23097.1 Mannosyltransferase family protein [Coccidioides posadasii C735 delta SOWgp]|eukprot:XP_003065242.1 Mannosyltransferase family protein [Coccidioides posadasii C735 delta SOWgp]